MAAALNALGVTGRERRGERGDFASTGGGGTFTAPEADLFVGNSGTTMRFLTAALPLGRGRYRIDGVPRMRQRPIAPLLAALNDLGADARSEAGTGCPPVVVRAAGLRGGQTRMAGDLSSPVLQRSAAGRALCAGWRRGRGRRRSRLEALHADDRRGHGGIRRDRGSRHRSPGAASASRPGQRYAAASYHDRAGRLQRLLLLRRRGGHRRPRARRRPRHATRPRAISASSTSWRRWAPRWRSATEYTEVRGPRAGRPARGRSRPGADLRHRPDPRRHRAVRHRSDDHPRRRPRAPEGDRPRRRAGDRAAPAGAGGRRVPGRSAHHTASHPSRPISTPTTTTAWR